MLGGRWLAVGLVSFVVVVGAGARTEIDPKIISFVDLREQYRRAVPIVERLHGRRLDPVPELLVPEGKALDRLQRHRWPAVVSFPDGDEHARQQAVVSAARSIDLLDQRAIRYLPDRDLVVAFQPRFEDVLTHWPADVHETLIQTWFIGTLTRALQDQAGLLDRPRETAETDSLALLRNRLALLTGHARLAEERHLLDIGRPDLLRWRTADWRYDDRKVDVVASNSARRARAWLRHHLPGDELLGIEDVLATPPATTWLLARPGLNASDFPPTDHVGRVDAAIRHLGIDWPRRERLVDDTELFEWLDENSSALPDTERLHASRGLVDSHFETLVHDDGRCVLIGSLRFVSSELADAFVNANALNHRGFLPDRSLKRVTRDKQARRWDFGRVDGAEILSRIQTRDEPREEHQAFVAHSENWVMAIIGVEVRLAPWQLVELTKLLLPTEAGHEHAPTLADDLSDLSSPLTLTRWEALRRLEELHDQGDFVVPQLIAFLEPRLLRNQHREDHLVAAASLATLGDRRAIPHLARRLRQELVIGHRCDALVETHARLAGRDAVPLLLELLEAKDRPTRTAAGHALQDLGELPAGHELSRRGRALQLSGPERRIGGEPRGAAETHCLEGLAGSTDERRQALTDLITVGTLRSVPALLRLLDSDDPADVTGASAQLQRLSDEDHGEDAAAWRAWWQQRSREDWAAALGEPEPTGPGELDSNLLAPPLWATDDRLLLDRIREELGLPEGTRIGGWQRDGSVSSIRLKVGDFPRPLQELPVLIGSLRNLRILELDGHHLQELPPFLSGLTGLRELELAGNQLDELPDTIGRLTQLRELDLSGNRLRQLPDSVRQLTQLRELSLADNDLTELPAAVEGWARIENLDLSGNQLRTLPAGAIRWMDLTKLNLAGNPLETLPLPLEELGCLSEIDLGGTRLTALPAQLACSWRLRRITLDDVPLLQVPEVLRDCKRLSGLMLRNTGLRELPPWIGELTELRSLDLRDNHLRTLPPEMSQLDELSWFKLHRNHFCKTLPVILRGHWPDKGHLTSVWRAREQRCD
ncbi:MAG: leucine-rich repeat domain-containing protein [Acidobacteriota bacterium]